MPKTIAYLGDQFSYHYIAAHAFIEPNITYIGFETFDKIVDTVLLNSCDFGILAIYNSLTGFVFDRTNALSNIERIIKNDFQVLQSIQLQIQLQFGALNKIPFHKIEKIFSHHVALKEAKTFLSQFSSDILKETSSTSSGVKEISINKLENTAAIGNREAMAHFGLEILAENIDDHPDNFTKFLLFRKKPEITFHTTNYPTVSSFVLTSNQNSKIVRSILMEDPKLLFYEKFSTEFQDCYYVEIQIESIEQKNNVLLKWQTKDLEIKILN